MSKIRITIDIEPGKDSENEVLERVQDGSWITSIGNFLNGVLLNEFSSARAEAQYSHPHDSDSGPCGVCRSLANVNVAAVAPAYK